MNVNKPFAVIVIVALLLCACGPSSTPASTLTPGATSLPGSVGIISAQEKLVESGAGDHLVPVALTTDYFERDTVRVTNGGIARLNLFTDQHDNQISILIFNDTAVGNVKVNPSGTTDPFVTLLLIFGGLTGEVPKNGGKPVQFKTPNGVNIFIIGTEFLVLFDPETNKTYIGNFGGTIAYSMPPGQSAQFTQAGQLYEISSNFEVKQSTMNFTRAQIEDRTSSTRSRLLDILNDYLAPTATPTTTITPIPALTPTIPPSPTRFIPCDKAAFVADVTIPDDTSFSPGSPFTKVWRLRNVGTCTWTTSYLLEFYRGDQMAGKPINLPSTVAPGQTVDIAVNLVASQLPGSYRGDWMLRNSSGTLFGVGARGTTPIWVKINVISPVTTTPVGLPDLTVSIVSGPTATCDPAYTGTPCSIITTVGFVITNTTQTDVTSTFQVLIEAIGLQSVTQTVNGLASGSSQNFVQTFRGGCFNPDCTARVTVDSGNAILEANETNNVAENTISPGAITGTALNEFSQPVSGFQVTLYDSTDQRQITSLFTDNKGKYTFANLSPGAYHLLWVAVGSCGSFPEDQLVTVTAGNPTRQDLITFVVC